MFSNANPMGHFAGPQVKMAQMTLGMVSMELERCKMSPVVNTEVYLDCLNKWVIHVRLCLPLFRLRLTSSPPGLYLGLPRIHLRLLDGITRRETNAQDAWTASDLSRGDGSSDMVVRGSIFDGETQTKILCGYTNVSPAVDSSSSHAIVKAVSRAWSRLLARSIQTVSRPSDIFPSLENSLMYRNPRERQVLVYYSQQWRGLRGGAVCCFSTLPSFLSFFRSHLRTSLYGRRNSTDR
jgi:hypothetical protein